MKLLVFACLTSWVALSISIPLETTTDQKNSDVSTTPKPHSIHERSSHSNHHHPAHHQRRHRRDSDVTSTSTTLKTISSMAEVRPSPDVPPHSIHARQVRQRDSNQHYQHQQYHHQHQYRHRREQPPTQFPVPSMNQQFPAHPNGQPSMQSGPQQTGKPGMQPVQNPGGSFTPMVQGPHQGAPVPPPISRQLRQVTESSATTKQPEMTPHLIGGDGGKPPLSLSTATEKRMVRDASKEKSSEELVTVGSSEERNNEKYPKTRRDASHSQESKSSEEDKATTTTESQRHVREVTSEVTTATSTSSATKEGSPHSLPRFPALRVTETTGNTPSETTAIPTTTKS